jgi:hypothetical protein
LRPQLFRRRLHSQPCQRPLHRLCLGSCCQACCCRCPTAPGSTARGCCSCRDRRRGQHQVCQALGALP